MERWQLDELVREEHSTYRWIFDAMLERAGFEILERVYRRSPTAPTPVAAPPTDDGPGAVALR